MDKKGRPPASTVVNLVYFIDKKSITIYHCIGMPISNGVTFRPYESSIYFS